MDFKEEQRLESRTAFIVYLLAALVTVMSMIIGMAGMLQEGESYYSVIWFAAIFVFIMIIVYIMMFRLTLETEISRNGFSFRYYPLIRNARLIGYNDIAGWELKTRNNWRDKITFGYKRSRLTKQTYFMFGGTDYLEIRSQNGNVYRFSTRNAYGISASMRKYCSEKEIVNGQGK